MVVRVAYCKDDTFGHHFDEMQDRCARDMEYEDWAEFMVIWRGHRLELYNNFVRIFSIPLRCLSSDERLLEIAWQRMGCRSQTTRIRCAPERCQNKVIPLLFYGHVFLHHMPPRVPAFWCEDTPAFSV